MKPTKQIAIAALLCFALLTLTGCADANTLTNHIRPGGGSPAGFWKGIWHGICTPFSVVGILFGMDIGFYEVFNTGNWYNFGFILGIGSLGGGGGAAARR